jgi:hypothetical protein
MIEEALKITNRSNLKITKDLLKKYNPLITSLVLEYEIAPRVKELSKKDRKVRSKYLKRFKAYKKASDAYLKKERIRLKKDKVNLLKRVKEGLDLKEPLLPLTRKFKKPKLPKKYVETKEDIEIKIRDILEYLEIQTLAHPLQELKKEYHTRKNTMLDENKSLSNSSKTLIKMMPDVLKIPNLDKLTRKTSKLKKHVSNMHENYEETKTLRELLLIRKHYLKQLEKTRGLKEDNRLLALSLLEDTSNLSEVGKKLKAYKSQVYKKVDSWESMDRELKKEIDTYKKLLKVLPCKK